MPADLSKLSDDELLRQYEATKAARPAGTADITKLSDSELHKAYLQALEKERPKASQGESAVRGAAQGATFGFSDEVVGIGGGILESLKGGNFAEGYRLHRDESRVANEAAYKDNPKTYIGGGLAGSVATSLIPGVGIAKGATLLGGMGKAAALGAVAGAGSSRADLTKPDGSTASELGKDVTLGAVIGGGSQGLFSVLGRAAGRMTPTKLRETANIKALKAAGALGSDLKHLGPEKVQAAGAAIHAAGLKAFDNLDEISAKIAAGKDTAGGEIGKILGSVDDLADEARNVINGLNEPPQMKAHLHKYVNDNFKFSMERVGDRIKKELIDPNANNPLLDAERAKLAAIAERFSGLGNVSMKDANIIKGTQGRVTNFNSETLPNAFKKEVYSIIRSEIDDVVAKLGNLEQGVGSMKGAVGPLDVAARNKAVSEAYSAAKRTYGALKDAEKINTARRGSFAGNREISLGDMVVGAGGIASGNPAQAVALTAASKMVRQYGDSVMAVGAKRLAEILERSPQALGKFYEPLTRAMQQGAPTLGATHVLLMKDPDYRAILEQYEKKRAIDRRAVGGP